MHQYKGYKILTADFCPPIQGGDPIWDGKTEPFRLPKVALDLSSAECSFGWNFTETPQQAFKILIEARRCLNGLVVVEVVGLEDTIKRGDKLRTSQLTIVRQLTVNEVSTVVATLATDAALSVRRAIARRAELDNAVVATLATDAALSVRYAIARRAELDNAVVATLATDADWSVRYAIAERAELDNAVVATLATDADWNVRRAIAERAELDNAVVATLATDADWNVRYAIARRAELDNAVVATLATDAALSVRYAIAERAELLKRK